MSVVEAGGQKFPALERAVAGLTPEGRAEALELIADARRPAEAIARALTAVGRPVSPSTIRTYRRLRREQEDTTS